MHGVPTGVADGHAAVCLAAQEDERDRAVRGNLRPSRDRLQLQSASRSNHPSARPRALQSAEDTWLSAT